jgi:lipopolysaccharide export system protein LptA
MKSLLTLLLFAVAAFPLAANTFSFRADSMSGGRATGREITVLTGNAEVLSDNFLLRADRIEIHGNDNRFVVGIGNVEGHELEKDIFFRTDRLSYDRTLRTARLEGNSTLEDRQNQVIARARFIEYDDINETAVLQISVRLFNDDLVSRAEFAVYNRIEQTLLLSGFPVVHKSDDEFRADRIMVDLNTNDIVMEGDVRGAIRN